MVGMCSTVLESNKEKVMGTGQTVEFAYAVDQQVKILISGGIGKVIGVFLGQSGKKMMLVQYADASKSISEQYFLESDLTSA